MEGDVRVEGEVRDEAARRPPYFLFSSSLRRQSTWLNPCHISAALYEEDGASAPLAGHVSETANAIFKSFSSVLLYINAEETLRTLCVCAAWIIIIPAKNRPSKTKDVCVWGKWKFRWHVCVSAPHPTTKPTNNLLWHPSLLWRQEKENDKEKGWRWGWRVRHKRQHRREIDETFSQRFASRTKREYERERKWVFF